MATPPATPSAALRAMNSRRVTWPALRAALSCANLPCSLMVPAPSASSTDFQLIPIDAGGGRHHRCRGKNEPRETLPALRFMRTFEGNERRSWQATSGSGALVVRCRLRRTGDIRHVELYRLGDRQLRDHALGGVRLTVRGGDEAVDRVRSNFEVLEEQRLFPTRRGVAETDELNAGWQVRGALGRGFDQGRRVEVLRRLEDDRLVLHLADVEEANKHGRRLRHLGRDEFVGVLTLVRRRLEADSNRILARRRRLLELLVELPEAIFLDEDYQEALDLL